MQAWTDGFVAVLDAVGSESASIFTMSGTGLAAMLLAASHPERVRSLVLWSPYARYVRAADHPVGLPEAVVDAVRRHVRGDMIGTGARHRSVGAELELATPPSGGGGREVSDLVAAQGISRRCSTCGCAPTSARCSSSIQAPTLVLRRRGDRDVRRDHARDLAERIPNARFVEFDGDDSVWFAGDADIVLDEIESFLTGQRSCQAVEPCAVDGAVHRHRRIDRTAAQLGDEAWTKALAAHDHLIEQHVTSWRGEVVKFTGDGALATFDGPARAIECARALSEAVEELGLTIRVGLHTGEVEKGDGDVHGIAVHVAARIMALAGPGEVLRLGCDPAAGARVATRASPTAASTN